MFDFDSENIDPFWQKENHSLDTSTWESNELRLKPLADNNPFDFFQNDALSEITNSNATQSLRSASIHSSDDAWTQDTYSSPQYNHTVTWDSVGRRPLATPFITETSSRIFEPIIRQSDADSVVIYERELVRHLIKAVHGVPSIYFSWSKDNVLQRHKSMRILGVSATCIEPVIDRVLLFATQLKELERVGHQLSSHGLTGMAFGSCLIEFHLNIQYTLMNEIGSIPDLTILQLQQWMEHLFFIVNRLYILCGSELPSGAGILNLLYEELKPLDLITSGSLGLYRDICFCFLEYTSAPYLNMMNQWLQMDIAARELEDPYNEFFIRINQNEDEQDVQNKYQLRPDCTLPYFIHKELASYILSSGISLRLLKKNKPNHLLFQMEDSISLKLLLNTLDGEKYRNQLVNVRQLIQLYNSNETVATTISPSAERHDMSEVDNDIECKLPALNKDILKDKEFSNKLVKLILNEQKETIPSIDTITNLSYIIPLEIWCPLLDESFMKSIFLNEQRLEYHLSILYQYYLLGNGLFSKGLESVLLEDISHVTLKDLIVESSCYKEDEFIHLTLSKDKQQLKLKYAVPYPFNILLTNQVVAKYDKVFQFLVELLRLNAMIKKCFEVLKEMKFKNKHIQHQIHKYRFELFRFITEFTSYIKSSIIESTWHPFIKNLREDVMNFREYQDFILDCILYPCFLKKGQVKILQVLKPIFNDISLFYQVLLGASSQNEDKIELKCRRIFEQFKIHTTIFIKVLGLLENKGSGRLSNILNTHHKHHHLDVFVQDLIIRLNSNHFYQ